MKLLILLISLVLVLVCFAETPLEYIGSELWANFECLLAEGNYLYAGFPYGVGVFDVSDSMDCFLTEINYIGEQISDISISGNYLFAAAHNMGLVVFDKSDPENIIKVTELALMDEVVTIEIEGNYAYIGGRLTGLHVVDISTPNTPSRVGFLTVTGGISDIVVDAGFVYLLRGLGGFSVVDATTPTSPSYRGSYSSATYLREGVKLGDHVFVAADISGVIVLDVSDPTSPTSVGSYPAPSSQPMVSIDIEGTTAYVAAGNYGIAEIDISYPLSPSYIDHYPMSITSALEVEVYGGMLYLATTEGLRILDVATDPSDMAFVSREDRHPDVDYIWASGTRMITCAGGFGMDCFNMPEMWNPTLTFHYGGGMNFDGAFYLSDYIYAAAGSDDLMIFESEGLYDFPTPITSVAVAGNAIDVQLDYSLCYVMTTAGISQVNVYDPTSPSVIAEGDASDPKAFHATPAFVYVCDEDDGFLIFDPLSMGLYGSDASAAGYDYTELNVVGDYAYASAGNDGIIIFDVSNPSAPFISAEYETDDDAEGIAISGDWLYVAMDRDGAVPYRILAPGDSLIEYDAFDTGGRANDIHADLNYVFVADRDALLILRNTEYGIEEDALRPTDSEIGVYPNPFNSSCRLDVPANALIQIYDITGKLVSSPVQFEGNYRDGIIWTPPPELPSGVYYANVATRTAQFGARLVLLK